ncbi:hypothetical protein ACFLIN_04705 [Corynebacterium kutscheri]|uniref:hypothetical protein n=1 Tax=Corynebacterium kutscheri TaxID=35755 RepID=UPI0037BF93FA
MRTTLRGFTPEQALHIVTTFCHYFPAQLEHLSFLSAIAAVSTSSFSGLSAYRSPTTQAQAVYKATVKLQPLSAHNEEFGAILRDLCLRLNEES